MSFLPPHHPPELAPYFCGEGSFVRHLFAPRKRLRVDPGHECRAADVPSKYTNFPLCMTSFLWNLATLRSVFLHFCFGIYPGSRARSFERVMPKGPMSHVNTMHIVTFSISTPIRTCIQGILPARHAPRFFDFVAGSLKF